MEGGKTDSREQGKRKCFDTFAFWYLTLKNEGKEEVPPQPCLVKIHKLSPQGEEKSDRKSRQAHNRP